MKAMSADVALRERVRGAHERMSHNLPARETALKNERFAEPTTKHIPLVICASSSSSNQNLPRARSNERGENAGSKWLKLTETQFCQFEQEHVERHFEIDVRWTVP